MSFGAFGTLIGHELAHAVSPEGLGFDASGVRRETWSVAARDAFNTRVGCLERQLDNARSSDAGSTDGHRTLDEYVADLVGIKAALAAMESDGRGGAAIQRSRRRDFFLAYAQQECGWSGNLDDPVDDEHPPPRVRINSVLSNVPEFADTFQCSAGTPLSPAKRCALW